MPDKRLGMLYIWNSLLDQLEFTTIMSETMGRKVWYGWNYGEMGKILLFHELIDSEVPFSSFLESHAAIELIGKAEWDFDPHLLQSMFKPYWRTVLQQLSSLLVDRMAPKHEWNEWHKAAPGVSMLISGSGGFPLDCGAEQRPDQTFVVVQGERGIAKAEIESIPFIASSALSNGDWEVRKERGEPSCFSFEDYKLEYFEERQGDYRVIWTLEHKMAKLPSDLVLALEDLKKQAWGMGYHEGVFWLEGQLKKIGPSFSSVMRKLKFGTSRMQGRVVFHWQYREKARYHKGKPKRVVTSLPPECTAPWIVDTLSKREHWKRNQWLEKIKNPGKGSEMISNPFLKAICWVLETHLAYKMLESGLSEDILLDDSIARIKWREQEIHIPGQASRWLARMFPSD